MMIKIGINGFGRIGRALAREAYKSPDFSIVGVNDVYDTKMMFHLFKNDSIYGKFKAAKSFTLDSKKQLQSLKWKDVDVVFECSGVYTKVEDLETHIKNGAKKVILSSYSNKLPTYIYGVNEKEYKGEKIISNSSCTGNCIVPIFKIIDQVFGVKYANITTIHSYTTEQSLLDTKNKDIRRARSSTQNIIPLFSNVSNAIIQFLPHLNEKVCSNSLRVPVANGVLIDCDIYIEQKSSKQDLINVLKKLSNQQTIFISKDKFVSSDIKAEHYSSIIDEDLIFFVDDDFFKIMIWQDNELGYVHRLLDMAKVVCED